MLGTKKHPVKVVTPYSQLDIWLLEKLKKNWGNLKNIETRIKNVIKSYQKNILPVLLSFKMHVLRENLYYTLLDSLSPKN